MTLSILALLLPALLAPPQAAPQHRPAAPAPVADVPFDNQKGRSLNFETGVIAPLCLSADGTLLFAINTQGSRLAIFDTGTWQRVNEIAIGLGGASIERRPGTRELWLVDRVDSCVSVIDPDLGAIVRTIRVGGEPYGICFTPSGDRAYVTCAAVNRVDVLDAATYSVVKSLNVPARSPRGITFQNGAAWLVPLLSGNNTAPRGTDMDAGAVVTVDKVAGAGLQPLPDRDLFAIRPATQPGQDRLDGGAVQTGLGTILFNVHGRPGTTEVWIPNTDALNAEHTGEVDFVGGQVVQNRITVADTTHALAPRVIDLDTLAPAGIRCAQPTGLAFDPVRPRVYVCGYGSDLVAVLGLGAGGATMWEGAIRIPPKQLYPRGSGPRACLVDPQGNWLYVSSMEDKSVTRIDLTTLPTSGPFVVTAPVGQSTGFELLSGAERLGRHLFNSADLSKSKTSSCGSCHVDGQTDGLVWDLSHFLDPEGTPRDQLRFGVDVKGPLVTQSTRRMEETGPFHWRGERQRMEDFNATFISLFEHEVGGVPSDIGGEFQYLTHYVNRIAIPPNPRENLDRTFTAEQRLGAQIFQEKPVLKGLTCAACHALPLGSSGEVVAHTPAGMLHSADVPSLRGIGDKVSPGFTIGGTFGRRTELGAGFTHGGAFGSISDVVLQTRTDGSGLPLFDVTPFEAHALDAFLMAFDTGLAPAAAFQVTANASNAAGVEANELPFLIEQMRRGNCQVIAVRTPNNVGGQFELRTAAYDVGLGVFQVPSATAPGLTPHDLIVEAQLGRPVTFMGVPIGTATSLALDRDLDGVLDLDERAMGMDPEFGNMDLDSYPDGYEIQWGMNPLVYDPPGTSGDTQAPQLVRPVRLIYATTNTLKFELETDEVCQLLVAYNGGYPVQRLPLAAHKDREFSVVLGNLEPDTNYQLDLTFKDPSGNVAVDSSAVFRTRPRVTVLPAHVETIALSVQPASGSGDVAFVDVDVRQGTANVQAGYVVLGSLYYQDASNALQLITQTARHQTDAAGHAVFQIPLSSVANPGGGSLLFVVHSIGSPNGAPDYVHAYDVVTTATAAY